MTPTVTSAARPRIRLPMPHAGQQRVRQEAARFNWLCAGRRWRKTTLVMPIAIEGALRGQQWVWGAPTFKQVRVGWDEARNAAGTVAQFNESRMEATFPTGGRIRYLSLDDPDNARGLTADGIEVDEASEIAERAWTEILRPMLLDTGGSAWFTFTPKGRGWTWREWLRAGEREDSRAWQIPTLGAQIVDGQLVRVPHAYENPNVSFDELRQMFETMPERTFRQEILAEFLEDGGAAFHGLERCLGGALEQRPPHATRQYVMGVDLAKSQDYTVVTVWDARDRRLVAFDRWNMCDWPMTKARIVLHAQIWNNALICIDATGVGDPVYDDLARQGLRIQPYVIGGTSRTPLLENFILMVEQARIQFPDVPQTAVLINEMKALEPQRNALGRVTYKVPENIHDDCIFGAALGVWLLAHISEGLPQSALDALLAKPIERAVPGNLAQGFSGITLKDRSF